MKICLDTCTYSHFKRGDPGAVQAISSARWIGISTIALGELRTGFRIGKHLDRNEHELRQFLENPFVHILDVDNNATYLYAQIVTRLRHAGTPVPTNDIWIAAITIQAGALLVTYDRHFNQIQHVRTQLLES